MARTRRAKGAGKAEAPHFEAWSYSRLKDYKECPQRAKFKFLDEISEPEPGKALVRGSKIHDGAEEYLKAPKAIPLMSELELFAEEFRDLRRYKASSESGFQFDKNWKPLDDWFDDAVWVRIKTDAEYTRGRGKSRFLVIIDFKTGKPRRWHDDQIELYALGGLLKYPEIPTVEAELWYTDHGDIRADAFTQDDVERLREKWTRQVRAMMADREFRPTPSTNTCKWCPFKKAKGGPCEF